MFSKSVDKELKKKVYSNLQTNPEENIASLKDRVTKDAKASRIEEVKDFMKIIKEMIKDKIPAKPKFYALLLLKEIMDCKKTPIVEYFIKKMLDRLFKIAQFNIKSSDPNKGQKCLDAYFSQQSKENSDFSQRFFTLLLECWKHWDELYSSTFSKIKDKCDKLRSIFPSKHQFLNHLENIQESNKLEKDIYKPLAMAEIPSFVNLSQSVSKKPENGGSSQNINVKQSQKDETFNKEKIQNLIEESINLKTNFHQILLTTDEKNFSEFFDGLYSQTEDLQRRMQLEKDHIQKSKNYDEKLKKNFSTESQNLGELIHNFDEYSRKNIDFESLLKSMDKITPKVTTPQNNDILQQKGLAFDDLEDEIEEKDFLENKRAFRESQQFDTQRFSDKRVSTDNNGAFGLETFGVKNTRSSTKLDNQTPVFQSSMKSLEPFPELVQTKTISFAGGFDKNDPRFDPSNGKRTSNFNSNFEPHDEQEENFNWNIDPLPEEKKNPQDFKTFASFGTDEDVHPFRKAKSVSQRTFKQESKPEINFTAKTKTAPVDFSPSTNNRNSNTISKISEEPRVSQSSMNFPIGRNSNPAISKPIPKQGTFGKPDEGRQTFQSQKTDFEITDFDNKKPLSASDPFGFQVNVSEEANSLADGLFKKDFRKKRESVNSKSNTTQQDHQSSFRRGDQSEFQQENRGSFRKSDKPEFNQEYQAPLSKNDQPDFRPEYFAKYSGFQESQKVIDNDEQNNYTSNKSGNQSLQDPFATDNKSYKKRDTVNSVEAFSGIPSRRMTASSKKFDNFADFGKAVDEHEEVYNKNYQSEYPNHGMVVREEDDEDVQSHDSNMNIPNFSKFNNNNKKEDSQIFAKKDNYEFDLKDSQIHSNIKSGIATSRDDFIINKNLQFNYDPKKNQSNRKSSDTRMIKDIHIIEDSLSGSQRNPFRRPTQDGMGMSNDNRGINEPHKTSQNSQTGSRKITFVNDFKDPVDLQEFNDKTPGKSTANSISGYRMGFTFAGGERRGKFDDTEGIHRASDTTLPKNQYSEISIKEKISKTNKFETFNDNKFQDEQPMSLIVDQSSAQKKNIEGLQSKDFSTRHAHPDPNYELIVEDLKTQNEFYRQQCKLLFDQWSQLNKQTLNESFDEQKQKSQLLKKNNMSVKLTESGVRNRAHVQSNLMPTESNISEKQTSKHKKKAELYTNLNKQYALYIEELKKELGCLIRQRKRKKPAELIKSAFVESADEQLQFRNQRSKKHSIFHRRRNENKK